MGPVLVKDGTDPMKTFGFCLMMIGAVAVPPAASAASNTTVGVGTGAIAGALVAGPVGAVVGAVVGGFVGSNSERARPRRYRRVRAVRRQSSTAQVRTASQRAEAPRALVAEPRTTASVPRPSTGLGATTWQNPR